MAEIRHRLRTVLLSFPGLVLTGLVVLLFIAISQFTVGVVFGDFG